MPGLQLQQQKSLPNIEPDELENPSPCIGSGSFGQCRTWYYPRFDINIVEKIMPDSNETTVYKEALYQQIFAHRCVPHVFGINNTKKPYSLFMEFVGKDLQSLTIHKLLYDKQSMDIMGSMTVPDWFRVCYDIADALQYIHEKGFLHCDIKTNNVLVSHHKNGYLIDFGKVKQIAYASGKKYAKVYNYIAPEVLNSHPPSPASDVYSFGIIIKAIGETIGDNTLLELGQQSSSAIPAQRPSMIRLLSALNPYTYTGNTLDKGQKKN